MWKLEVNFEVLGFSNLEIHGRSLLYEKVIQVGSISSMASFFHRGKGFNVFIFTQKRMYSPYSISPSSRSTIMVSPIESPINLLIQVFLAIRDRSCAHTQKQASVMAKRFTCWLPSYSFSKMRYLSKFQGLSLFVQLIIKGHQHHINTQIVKFHHFSRSSYFSHSVFEHFSIVWPIGVQFCKQTIFPF